MADGYRFVVVDNLEINRVGTSAILERIPGVTVVEACDFDEALSRAAWDDVDWVVADIADESAEVETTPAVPLFERIRATSPGDSPRIVAVTGNPSAFRSAWVARRIYEADPDAGLVWRQDLETALLAAIDASSLAQQLKEVPQVEAPEVLPDGVGMKTKLNRVIDQGRPLLDAVAEMQDRRNDRKTWEMRYKLMNETGLEPEGILGRRPANTDVPGVRQIRRVIESVRIDNPAKEAAPPLRERLRRKNRDKSD